MKKQKPVKLIATLIISIISLSVAAYFAAYFVGYSVWIIITGIVILVFVILFHQDRRIEFKAPAVPDKYRLYLAVLLTIASLLSILPLSQKVVEAPPLPSIPWYSVQQSYEEPSPILPHIIVVSVLTVFIAITTYMRKFYPYSIVFALALVAAVYTIIPMTLVMFIIPVVGMSSASWQHKKLSIIFPFSYSAVLGIITGVEAPASYIGWDMLPFVFLTLGITFLSGIITIVLFVSRSKSISANEDFNKALRATLSLIVFFVAMSLAYSHIFHPFCTYRCFD